MTREERAAVAAHQALGNWDQHLVNELAQALEREYPSASEYLVKVLPITHLVTASTLPAWLTALVQMLAPEKVVEALHVLGPDAPKALDAAYRMGGLAGLRVLASQATWERA